MNAKNYLLWISLFVIALVAGLGATQAQTGDVVTENDGVKADLAGDPDFYQRVLAEDKSGGREGIRTPDFLVANEEKSEIRHGAAIT